MNRFSELFKELEGAMENVSDAVSKADTQAAEAAKGSAALARYLMAALTVLGLVVSIAMIVFAQKGIVSPLTLITRALDRLAGGDLKTEVPSVKSEDEIGRMARALSIFKSEMMGRQSEVEARKARDLADAERARHESIQRAQEEQRRDVVASLADAAREVAAGIGVDDAFEVFDILVGLVGQGHLGIGAKKGGDVVEAFLGVGGAGWVKDALI